jgi:HlyD family secretion protein
MTLRAYITGTQLSRVRIGESATITYDIGDDALGSRDGVVTSVADKAEFTPTPIQTREERAEFVYAVEIDVPNPDGALKIGMPAEVTFPRSGPTDERSMAGDDSARPEP